MWFVVWLGVPASLQFGCRFPGRIPDGAGGGGPLLVSGVADFEALAFGGQLRGEGSGASRTGVVVLGMGADRLLEGVGFGLRDEPKVAADVGRGGGASPLTLEGSCFEFTAVQAADDVGFIADFQSGEDGLAHCLELGLGAVRHR